ncbi:MAG: ribonuclease P protein component [Gemmatimonadota bacterium]|nr:MAG: ribonuclease P protein component [Gemmatimonadota bacterium]
MPTFPKNERLRRTGDFSAVFREKKHIDGKNISLFVRKNRQSESRIGIVVSKRVGNAVQRNRIKRQLRESYRIHKYILEENMDVVLIAKPSIIKAGNRNINTEVLNLLQCIHQKM